ncbi:hypothetical protein STTU_0003 [Streptomyces sp. Tu6071]|nr:hypothetical protein STTU_0003 [Streptomyces sp. Tu6071]
MRALWSRCRPCGSRCHGARAGLRLLGLQRLMLGSEVLEDGDQPGHRFPHAVLVLDGVLLGGGGHQRHPSSARRDDGRPYYRAR